MSLMNNQLVVKMGPLKIRFVKMKRKCIHIMFQYLSIEFESCTCFLNPAVKMHHYQGRSQ